MNFIEVYDNALSPELCKKIIEYFEEVPLELKRNGQIYGENYNDITVDKNYKDSTDVWMNFHTWSEPDKILASTLLQYIQTYREKYKEIDNVATWELSELYNLQKYEPGQGYHQPHCENMDGPSPRILAWMFYLNTVTDKGGTHFTNWDFTTDAVEGRLVIWPAYWTHTHHGVMSETQTKYIATGWYDFEQKVSIEDLFNAAIQQNQ